MPDELRSYVGCHESSSQAPETGKGSACPETKGRNALSQVGEATAQKTLSYARDVQTIWDKYCIQCHNSQEAASKFPKPSLNAYFPRK